MSALPQVVQKLIEEFEKLPGVGPKSAARMAYHYLRASRESAERLSALILDVKNKVKSCEICYNFTENSPCSICSDPGRNQNLLMVVEEPLDVVAFDRVGIKEEGGFGGVFHVLGGVISPVNSVGPEDLRISELIKRIEGMQDCVEIIIATNPNLEGEATAMYIYEEIKNRVLERVKITRLARGLPTGADLEYADYTTLRRAIEGRTEL
ncbi:recombination protein RecR [Candidatus Dojkabacteria bacterium]|nr:recombination protein RecR [Candidatus Dojkabacteria bacterium]